MPTVLGFSGPKPQNASDGRFFCFSAGFHPPTPTALFVPDLTGKMGEVLNSEVKSHAIPRGSNTRPPTSDLLFARWRYFFCLILTPQYPWWFGGTFPAVKDLLHGTCRAQTLTDLLHHAYLVSTCSKKYLGDPQQNGGFLLDSLASLKNGRPTTQHVQYPPLSSPPHEFEFDLGHRAAPE